MDPRLTELLRDMEAISQKNGGVPCIAREAGQFLNLLVKSTRAVNVLEVGTDDGYDTLWLAEAAAANNGKVLTIEHDVWHLELAQEAFTRSPHADRINMVAGEALEILPVLEGPFDFILLDADKEQAFHYLQIVLEQTSSGGVICCEKAISRAGTLSQYLTYVHDRYGLESVLIPIGEGIEVTVKLP